MKKWLLAGGLIFLTGCTEEKNQENDPIIATPEEAEPGMEEGVLGDVVSKQQFTAVIEDIANRYSFLRNNHTYYSDPHEIGIVYSELLDFDADGQDELYILFKSSAYMNDPLKERNQDGYIQEIWQSNVKGEKATLLNRKLLEYEHAKEDLEITLVAQMGGPIYLKYTSTDAQGKQRTEYHTKLSERFEQTMTLGQNVAHKDEYQVNDESVERQTYEQEIEKLEGTERPIIVSKQQKREFAIDLSKSNQSTTAVMDELAKDINHYLSEGKAASEEIAARVEEVLNEFHFLNSFDTRNTNDYEQLVTSLILHGYVDNDAPATSYFLGYTEGQIIEAMKTHFDITFSPADLDVPEPEEGTANFLTYRDGVYYVLPSDLYNDYVMRDIEQVVQVSESIYYVRFKATGFGTMDYMMAANVFDFNVQDYEDKPHEQWPEKATDYFTNYLPSYAVIQLDGEQTKIVYQGYANLTDKELEQF